VRDKGARELVRAAAVVPEATIAAPGTATAGASVAFSGSAANEPPGTALGYAWAFSDGATASGQSVSHAFAAAGAASATLTVTAPGGCVGTAKLTISIVPKKAQLDVLTAVKLAPSAFYARPSGPSVLAAAKRKRTYGTLVSYSGSQPATTTFTVQRRDTGRRQGKSCRKPSRTNRGGKRCTYYTSLGSFKHADKAGAISFRFTGRVKSQALKAGPYRLQAIPRNAAGTGRAAYQSFTVKKVS
jgi:PKD repeat protein